MNFFVFFVGFAKKWITIGVSYWVEVGRRDLLFAFEKHLTFILFCGIILHRKEILREKARSL